MTYSIDVHDLPEEQVKLVQEFVDFLREKTKKNKATGEDGEDIAFKAWPLGVKGKLTTEEIYDYL